MAEIAVAVNRALAQRARTGAGGATTAVTLGRGEGWTVADVICTCRPDDRPFEEQHVEFAVAVVAAGVFQHRCAAGRALMTPGSMMLGNAGACFECGHPHGAGDRCVSFWYSVAFLQRLAADLHMTSASKTRFRLPAIPPMRETARFASRAVAGVIASDRVSWNELAVEVAVSALTLSSAAARPADPPAHVESRVAEAVSFIEANLEQPLTLDSLAARAHVSPFHFLRSFEAGAGATPHQYVRRARLRQAATRLVTEDVPIIDVALGSGFGDVSNFTRAFGTEFGMSPRQFRNRTRARHP